MCGKRDSYLSKYGYHTVTVPTIHWTSRIGPDAGFGWGDGAQLPGPSCTERTGPNLFCKAKLGTGRGGSEFHTKKTWSHRSTFLIQTKRGKALAKEGNGEIKMFPRRRLCRGSSEPAKSRLVCFGTPDAKALGYYRERRSVIALEREDRVSQGVNAWGGKKGIQRS